MTSVPMKLVPMTHLLPMVSQIGALVKTLQVRLKPLVESHCTGLLASLSPGGSCIRHTLSQEGVLFHIFLIMMNPQRRRREKSAHHVSN